MSVPPPSVLANTLIAVIDDEADVRKAMRMLLQEWGCRVFTAEDSTSLLAALGKAGLKPDIVIADFRLREGLTGPEAIRQVESHYGVTIPSFIISGDTAPEVLKDALTSGHLLLHKPVQPAKLRALLQDLIRTGVVTSNVVPAHPTP
jgi:CheY-like chemotaxis protein